jgi:hypothetical protein
MGKKDSKGSDVSDSKKRKRRDASADQQPESSVSPVRPFTVSLAIPGSIMSKKMSDHQLATVSIKTINLIKLT